MPTLLEPKRWLAGRRKSLVSTLIPGVCCGAAMGADPKPGFTSFSLGGPQKKRAVLSIHGKEEVVRKEAVLGVSTQGIETAEPKEDSGPKVQLAF